MKFKFLIVVLFVCCKLSAQFKTDEKLNSIRVIDSSEFKLDLDFFNEEYAFFTFKQFNRYETLLVEYNELNDTIFLKELDDFLPLSSDVYLEEDTLKVKELINIQFMYRNPFMNRERTWLNAFYVVNGDTIENDLVYSDATHDTYIQRPDTNILNIQIHCGAEHLIRELDVYITQYTNEVKIDIFDLFSALFFNEHHYKELFPTVIEFQGKEVVLFLIDSED